MSDACSSCQDEAQQQRQRVNLANKPPREPANVCTAPWLLAAIAACVLITVLLMQTFFKSILRAAESRILSHTLNRLQLEKRVENAVSTPKTDLQAS